jgi:hypothetical protein
MVGYSCSHVLFYFWNAKLFNGDIRRFLFQVYYSEDTATVEISNIGGRCEVLRPGPVLESAVKAGATNLFFCSRFCDPKTGTVKQVLEIQTLSVLLLETMYPSLHGAGKNVHGGICILNLFHLAIAIRMHS